MHLYRFGIAVLLLTGAACAWEDFALGARAGVVLSSFRGEGLDACEEGVGGKLAAPLASCAFGLFGVISYIEDFIGLQPEIAWQRRGGVWRAQAPDAARPQPNQERIYADYLEMPLLLRVMIPMDIVRPHLLIGPSAGIALHHGADALGSETGGHARLDIGLRIGCGADIFAGPGSIAFDVRYGAGLLDFFRNHDDVKTRFGSLTAGYCIDF
jgi:hypothetical protein